MGDAITMRVAEADDAAAFAAVAEAAYTLYIPRIGRRPMPMDADFPAHVARGEAFAAVEERAVVGYIIMFPRGDHMFIENVAVDPACQGRGIGAVLLDHGEKEARRQDLRAVELYTNEKMTENLTFYPRLGYRETDRRSENGFNRVYFRKELHAA